MVINLGGKFTKATIYPHAYRVVTVGTSSDRLTITDEGNVFWDTRLITRNEADIYLANMKEALDRAFQIADEAKGKSQ